MFVCVCIFVENYGDKFIVRLNKIVFKLFIWKYFLDLIFFKEVNFVCIILRVKK